MSPKWNTDVKTYTHTQYAKRKKLALHRAASNAKTKTETQPCARKKT